MLLLVRRVMLRRWRVFEGRRIHGLDLLLKCIFAVFGGR